MELHLGWASVVVGQSLLLSVDTDTLSVPEKTVFKKMQKKPVTIAPAYHQYLIIVKTYYLWFYFTELAKFEGNHKGFPQPVDSVKSVNINMKTKLFAANTRIYIVRSIKRGY